MSTLLNIENIPVGGKVEQVFSHELEAKYKKVEKEADKTISSFANLVDELIKLKELSTGTQVKEKITRLTSELNNTSVFFTKMISDELSALHGIINPNTSVEAAEFPSA